VESGEWRVCSAGFPLEVLPKKLLRMFEKGRTAGTGTTQGRSRSRSRCRQQATRKHRTGDGEFAVSKRLHFSCADMRPRMGGLTGESRDGRGSAGPAQLLGSALLRPIGWWPEDLLLKFLLQRIDLKSSDNIIILQPILNVGCINPAKALLPSSLNPSGILH
jgi:hypothetical protein